MSDKLRLPDLQGINRGLRVLLVEDDDHDAKIVMDLLQRDRRVEHIARAVSVDEALIALEEGPGPDLVITDLNLPGRNGVDLLSDLRKREIADHSFRSGPVGHVPVVVLTDSDRAIDFHKVSQAEANTFITKPDTHDELQTMLRRLVRSVIWGHELPSLMSPEIAAAAQDMTASASTAG